MKKVDSVSIICPVYNEELYIENILSFFVNSKIENKELFIIDGGSSDNTVYIVNKYIAQNSKIKLLINKDKYEVIFSS